MMNGNACEREKNMIIGSKLYYEDEVDSTNIYAKSLLNTASDGTIVLADLQTAGKGRLDRPWYSPVGGIWMSVILKPEKPNLIPVLTSVSLCETFSTYDILLGLKWPNDVMLNKKKVAGILCEVVDQSVIVGIGLNLNIKEFPPELRNTATSIFIETKKSFDKMAVFQMLCKEIDYNYMMLKGDHVSHLLTKWRHYTIMLGKDVTIELPGGKVTGRVLDISSDGGLVIMKPDNTIERILAGDCQLVSM